MATVKMTFTGSKADAMTIFAQVRNTIMRPAVGHSMIEDGDQTTIFLEIEMPERIKRAYPRHDPLRIAGVLKHWDADLKTGYINFEGEQVYFSTDQLIGDAHFNIRAGLTVTFRRVLINGAPVAKQVCFLDDPTWQEALIAFQSRVKA